MALPLRQSHKGENMQSSRIYPPRNSSGIDNPSDTPAGALANIVGKWTQNNEERNLKRQEAGAELNKETQIENLKAAHAARLEQQKAKNRLSEKLAVAAAKGSVAKKKKYKDPDMLEQFMLTKGHFPAAMKVKKTAKGTDNPFAEYTPEDETKHIMNLAQLRGYVPDQTTEMAGGHEGGIMGIGGKDIAPRVIQTYKPGPDAGGSIENAAPDTGDEPQVQEQE
jgi:hypothetical protein